MCIKEGIKKGHEDEKVAALYLKKMQSARDRHLGFHLSFREFKTLMKKKRCVYTGVEMTAPKAGGHPLTTRTLERVNNKLGYVKGNVIAVCHYANQLKSIWEDSSNCFSINHVVKMLIKLQKLEGDKGVQDEKAKG